MLTAIVLLWIAIKLQAPTWVYIIVSFMLVTGVLNILLDLIDKWQKRQIEMKVSKLSDEQLEKLKEWLKENGE